MLTTKLLKPLTSRVTFHLIRAIAGAAEGPVEEGFQMYRVNAPKTDPTIDIVFIHGLGGDAVDTWTAESSQKHPETYFWPSEVAGWVGDGHVARVLTYGYPASRTALGNAFKIKQHGEFLANSLIAARVGARPAIFITHSLGGLVLKRALLHCLSTRVTNDHRYAQVPAATRGVVFLGVPHMGSLIASFIGVIEKLSRLKIEADITKELEFDFGEGELSELDEHFRARVVKTADVKVCCLAEGSDTLGMRVVTVLSAHGKYDGDNSQVPGSHVTVAKPQPGTPLLQKVRDRVNDWTKLASGPVAVEPTETIAELPEPISDQECESAIQTYLQDCPPSDMAAVSRRSWLWLVFGIVALAVLGLAVYLLRPPAAWCLHATSVLPEIAGVPDATRAFRVHVRGTVDVPQPAELIVRVRAGSRVETVEFESDECSVSSDGHKLMLQDCSFVPSGDAYVVMYGDSAALSGRVLSDLVEVGVGRVGAPLGDWLFEVPVGHSCRE